MEKGRLFSIKELSDLSGYSHTFIRRALRQIGIHKSKDTKGILLVSLEEFKDAVAKLKMAKNMRRPLVGSVNVLFGNYLVKLINERYKSIAAFIVEKELDKDGYDFSNILSGQRARFSRREYEVLCELLGVSYENILF